MGLRGEQGGQRSDGERQDREGEEEGETTTRACAGDKRVRARYILHFVRSPLVPFLFNLFLVCVSLGFSPFLSSPSCGVVGEERKKEAFGLFFLLSFHFDRLCFLSETE
jgi:hypothetical protein